MNIYIEEILSSVDKDTKWEAFNAHDLLEYWLPKLDEARESDIQRITKSRSEAWREIGELKIQMKDLNRELLKKGIHQ